MTTLETIPSEPIGQSPISSEYDPLTGYWYCVVDDDAWSRATMMDYVGGFPIYTRRP